MIDRTDRFERRLKRYPIERRLDFEGGSTCFRFAVRMAPENDTFFEMHPRLTRAVSVFVYRVDRPSRRIERRETAQAEACGSERRNRKCANDLI